MKDYDDIVLAEGAARDSKFANETSAEFFNWVTENPAPVNFATGVNALYYNFCVNAKIGYDHKFFTLKRFNVWLRAYGIYINCKISFYSKSGVRFIIFHKQS